MTFLRQIDRQDLLLVVGLVSLLGGIAVFSRPVAAIVFGFFCFFAVWTIERVKSLDKGKVADGSDRK
jgi:hypothetical protein